MAAHSVTILVEMSNASAVTLARKAQEYIHALDYAPGMDELDFDDWRALHMALGERAADKCTDAQAHDAVVSALGTQISKWKALGRPRTHEEWAEATAQGVRLLAHKEDTL